MKPRPRRAAPAGPRRLRTWSGAVLALHALALPGAGLAADWPTRHRSASGYELAVKGLYQFQFEQVDDARAHPRTGAPWLADHGAWRRKEFGLSAKAPWGVELALGYDFTVRNGVHPSGWLDNYLRYTSPRIGAWRLGQFKTPVGLDATNSSSATTFIERALPVQAIGMGRRLGIDWTHAGAGPWLLQAAWFAGGDLNGDNDGHGPALRAVWTPLRDVGDTTTVLHLGLALSRERRSASRDGRGLRQLAVARFRARPETGLGSARLVDSGVLPQPGAIDRIGLELAWIDGPWLVQGEYLRVTTRPHTAPRFTGTGWYLQGAWLLTGASRPWSKGTIGNAPARGPWGAFELALRCSALDLDDGPVRGGHQRDWTLGANWYLDRHFKLQANYIRARSRRHYGGAVGRVLDVDPAILEARIQLQF